MKLISVRLPETRPKELVHVREFRLDNPLDHVVGWTVAVRGPALILICPDGAFRGGYEFARAQCALKWDGVAPADYEKIQNWTSEPMRRPGAEPDAVDDKPQQKAAK